VIGSCLSLTNVSVPSWASLINPWPISNKTSGSSSFLSSCNRRFNSMTAAESVSFRSNDRVQNWHCFAYWTCSAARRCCCAARSRRDDIFAVNGSWLLVWFGNKVMQGPAWCDDEDEINNPKRLIDGSSNGAGGGGPSQCTGLSFVRV
jgi:hypothetical protein